MYGSLAALSGILLFHGSFVALGEASNNTILSLRLIAPSSIKGASFPSDLSYDSYESQKDLVSQGLPINAPDSPRNPPSRSSGGGRAPCSSLMAAMVPGIGTFLQEEDCVAASDTIRGHSISSQPQLWLYVPGSYTPEAVLKLRLMHNYRTIVEQDFPVPTEAGLLSLQLDYALEPGHTYTWIAEVMVDTGRGRARNPRAGGIVEYQPAEPGFLAQVDGIPPVDKAQQYGEQGFWYDALSELAALRKAEPDNAEALTAWRELLASYGLEIFAEQPFLDCCLVED